MKTKALFSAVGLAVLLVTNQLTSAAAAPDDHVRPLSTPAPLVGCTWDGCAGKDPDPMGCQPGRMLLQEVHGHFKVGPEEDFYPQLSYYYSASCRSAWAEFVLVGPDIGAVLYLTNWREPQFGGATSAHLVEVDETNVRYRTAMWSWNESVKGCYSMRQSDPDPQGTGHGPPDIASGCTRWY